ncbi:MAG: cupin domain-containing protein [Actinobacteria bacterium]|nr:cupin domain-containing protein [Actinomycetota bacterium]
MSRGVVLEPGAGEVITERRARTVQIKVGTEAIAVTETRYERGQHGPEPHVHLRHTDAFYVLEGELALVLGPEGEVVRAPAGSFAAAPPGVVHTFRNDGPERARFLNLHAPSERFADHLRELRDGLASDWFDQLDPPDDGGRALEDAIVLPPGEGETISVGRSSVVLKGTGERTDGHVFLSETSLEPGFPGPPAHLHRELHDLFYVLEGTLTLRNGAETVSATPGSLAWFPPGAVHTFANGSGAPVRFLNFNAPAGWESYMRDLAALQSRDRPPTPEEIGAIASRYDFHVVT